VGRRPRGGAPPAARALAGRAGVAGAGRAGRRGGAVTAQPASDRSGVWWLSPTTITLIVVAAAVLPTALIPDASFRAQWDTPKAITTATCLLFLAGGLALALGALVVAAARRTVPGHGRWPALRPDEVDLLRRCSTVLVTLTVVGYLAFVVAAVRGGVGLGDLRASLGSEGLYGADIKERTGTVPGLTTLTQVGLAAAVVSSLLLCTAPTRRELGKLVLVVGLSVPRAFLLTERLAVLELVVPVAVVLAARFGAAGRGRAVVRMLPAVALPVVMAVFAAFEYSRSWTFYRATTDGGFLRFAVERLAGYYTTSLNNGQLELLHANGPANWPYATLEAFWTAPVIGQVDLYQSLSGGPAVDSLDVLTVYANPEFNNGSGLAPPFIDYGTVGGLLYFLAAGVVAGLLYRGFRESHPAGLLIYPVVFIGLLELPRYLHWAQGRALPAFLALGVVAVLLHRAARRTPAEPRPPVAAGRG